MGESGSWFCNCVISSCINMLSIPPVAVLLLLPLLLLVWADAEGAELEADTGLVFMVAFLCVDIESRRIRTGPELWWHNCLRRC